MQLKVFDQDKANHYAYGSWVATAFALVVLAAVVVLCLVTQRVAPPVWTTGVAALAAVLGAFMAGKTKEQMDAAANAEAAARGEKPPHGVETADWQATAWGALPVAAPLLVLQLVAVVLHRMVT